MKRESRNLRHLSVLMTSDEQMGKPNYLALHNLGSRPKVEKGGEKKKEERRDQMNFNLTKFQCPKP